MTIDIEVPTCVVPVVFLVDIWAALQGKLRRSDSQEANEERLYEELREDEMTALVEELKGYLNTYTGGRFG